MGTEQNLKMEVSMLPTQEIEDFRKLTPRLRTAFGAKTVLISEISPRTIELLVLRTDPLDAVTPIRTPRYGEVNAGTMLNIGLNQSGEYAGFSLANASAHLAIQGQTRSGKTVLTYGLLMWASAMPDIVVAGCDPTNITLAPWAESRHGKWQSMGTKDVETHVEVLDRVVEVMDQRVQGLAARDIDKLSSFSPEEPLFLVVLEEYPALLETLKVQDKAAYQSVRANVSRLLLEGAKAGIRVLMIIQRADASIIGGVERSNIAIRFSLRVDNADAVRMLHEGIDKDLSEMVTGFKNGLALMQVPGEPISRMRVAYVDSYSAYSSVVRANIERSNNDS